MLDILRGLSELEAQSPQAGSEEERQVTVLTQQRDSLSRRIAALTAEIERKERESKA